MRRRSSLRQPRISASAAGIRAVYSFRQAPSHREFHMRIRAVSTLLLSLVAGLVPATAQNPRERSVLVTVLDPAGAPVQDVKPADLAVIEDGATREVIDVKPA